MISVASQNRTVGHYLGYLFPVTDRGLQSRHCDKPATSPNAVVVGRDPALRRSS
jgi:hypothetical protein